MTAHAASGPAAPGGNGKGRSHGPTKENPAPGAGPFGLAIFLVSLAVLFLGSLIAYAVIRSRAPAWPPPGLPRVPSGLRISTAILALASVSLEWAARSLRPYRPAPFRVAIAVSLAAGLGFLISQCFAWVAFVQAIPHATLYSWLFLFLTGLHAAHVLGGLVPLVIVTVKAFHGLIPTAPGGGDVRATATYWHFLGLVWVTLYGMLLLTT